MSALDMDRQRVSEFPVARRRSLSDSGWLSAGPLVGLLCVIVVISGCTAEQSADPTAARAQSQTPQQSQTLSQEQTLPQAQTPASVATTQQDEAPQPTVIAEASSGQLIAPTDFHYLGAFRLPHVGEGPSNWEYSGYAMTYFPSGDAAGEEDGFPGSLFIVGHDHQQMIAEMSIPRPVIPRQRQLTELNVAETLQPFADIRGGLVGELEIPRLGIEYLSDTSVDSEGRLHFCVGQHFEFDRTPTHGSKGMRLDAADTRGLWFIGDHSNYVLNDYLFEIPDSWSSRNLSGYRLATGRFRDGQWGGLGPAVIAYQPPSNAKPPESGASIENCVPLLMYGEPQPGAAELLIDPERQLNGFSEADEWSGGAWLTAAERSAMMLLGTKATGDTWYGFSNGVVYPVSGDESDPIPDVPPFPHDQRGWWSESIRAEAILFDPEELAAVARGEMKPWQPQPYATVDLSPHLLESDFEHVRQKRYLLGACAFDRGHGNLYVIERRVKADEERSVVHVFRIGSD